MPETVYFIVALESQCKHQRIAQPSIITSGFVLTVLLATLFIDLVSKLISSYYHYHQTLMLAEEQARYLSQLVEMILIT